MKTLTQSKPAGIALVLGSALWLLSGIRIPAAAAVASYTALSLDIGPYLLAPAALLLLAGLAGLITGPDATPGMADLLGLGIAATGCIAVAGAGLSGSGRGDLALAPGLSLLSAGLLVVGSRLMMARARRGWQALPLLLGLLGLLLPMGAGVDGAPGLATWLVFGIGWLWMGGIALCENPAPSAVRSP